MPELLDPVSFATRTVPFMTQKLPSSENAFAMYESAFRPYVNVATSVSAGVCSSPIVVQARAEASGKRYVTHEPYACDPLVAPAAAPGTRRMSTVDPVGRMTMSGGVSPFSSTHEPPTAARMTDSW